MAIRQQTCLKVVAAIFFFSQCLSGCSESTSDRNQRSSSPQTSTANWEETIFSPDDKSAKTKTTNQNVYNPSTGLSPPTRAPKISNSSGDTESELEFMLGGGCEFVGTDTMPQEVCKTNSYDDNPFIYKTADGATCGSAPDGTGYIRSAPAGSSLGSSCETTTTDHPVECNGKNNRCFLNFENFDVLGAYDVEIACDDGGDVCPPDSGVCGIEEVPEDGSDLYVTDDTRGSPNPQINLESHSSWPDITALERVILSADPNDNDSFTASTPSKQCGDNTFDWTVSGKTSKTGSGKYFSFIASQGGDHLVELTVKDSVSPTPNQGSANESFTAAPKAVSNPKAVAQITTNAPYYENDPITYDSDNSIGSGLSYDWTFKTKPSTSGLDNSDLVNNDSGTFNPDEPGNYRLKLEVSNGNGSDTDTTSLIPVLPELDVEASVATDSPYSPSDTIALDGSQNYGKSSGYSDWDWEVVKAPSGSSATAGDVFKNGSANGYQTATFDLDANGNFQFRLGMGDNSGNSGVGTTKVISVGTTLNADAELNGSGPYTVNNSITYNGSNSTGSIGGWQWRIQDTPANYSGNFANGFPLGTGNGNGYKSGNFTPDATGNWTLVLGVNSSTSNASDTDTTTAEVVPAASLQANAQFDGTDPYTVGQRVTYNGSNTTGSINDWEWRAFNVPNGSGYYSNGDVVASGNGNGYESGSFVPDAPGNWKLELWVSNGNSNSTAKTRAATVDPSSLNADARITEPSDIGSDIYLVNESITYDGTNTTGPYDEWEWRTRPPSPVGGIIEEGNVADKKIGNYTPSVTGNYKLELYIKDTSTGNDDRNPTTEFEVVECYENSHCTGSTPFCDNSGGSPSYDCVQCTSDSHCGSDVCESYNCVSPNSAPTADAQITTSSPYEGESIDYSGTNSTDSDGSIADYRWVVANKPNGSNLKDSDLPNGSGEATGSFFADVAGNYELKLTVEDDDGATDTDTTVNKNIPNPSPTCSASLNPSDLVYDSTCGENDYDVECNASDDNEAGSDLDITIDETNPENKEICSGNADGSGNKTCGISTESSDTGQNMTFECTVTDDKGKTGTCTVQDNVESSSGSATADIAWSQ